MINIQQAGLAGTVILALALSSEAMSSKSVAFKSSLIERPLIAQAFLDKRCPDQYVYLLGYTKSYEVIICGQRRTGKPTHYLGISKKSGSSILLPLRTYTKTRFSARNGKYTYTLNLNTQTLTLGIPGRAAVVESFTAETP